MIPFAFLALAAQLTAPPPSNTTDVDASTTPAQASPLAPAQATGPRTLDDILSNIPPYEPPVDAKPAPHIDEAPRAGMVLPVTPGGKTTYLTDFDARPDGPPSDADTLYENRVLGAFRAAEGSQGPLDGRWVVAKTGGDILYTLQFSDSGRGPVEGAWRDMKATGRASTGFIDVVQREDAGAVVRFSEGGLRSAELRVHPAADGGWIGEAITPSGKISVVMTRDVGVERVAAKAPLYIPPPPPPPSERHSGKHGKHGKAAKGHGGKASKSKGSSKSHGGSSKKKRHR